ncbi:hypothetical protein SCARR_01650 [Pontiella sulfatireligans]|uniref:Uncharacterized protein n=2 Tax=Pontiella sulfatireligans TaxID=2750658 RepID=A0A6C2UJK1_9BACT|nr:hypothetical protein SCARR_01650 [Pontiella sulfatireligans]
MKQKQMHLLALLIPLLIGAAAQAGSITNYYDDFEGTVNGANLNGRTVPEGTLTANWFSKRSIQTTGSAAKIVDGSAAPSNASLKFTPEAGKVYTLSADLNNISTANFDTIWLGFRDTNNGKAAFSTRTATAARVFRKADGNYTIQTEGSAGIVTASGAGTMKVVLDTTKPEWTITTYWNGEIASDTNTCTKNPTISHAGFGFSEGGGAGEPRQFNSTVDNFSLTVIPKPATVGLVTAP